MTITHIRTTALIGILSIVCAVPGFAQQPAPSDGRNAATGRVVGRIVDAQSGAGLSAVTIQVVGTPLGAISGLDGRFAIGGVPAGRTTLRVTSLGFATKTVTDVEIAPNGVVEQNISLETEAVSIGAIEVTAAAERGSVNRALDFQRTAAAITNAVTAEQITRSPDSDAAQAVQRVSGVTVQDGKFVVVRGLGERYTTTSLNGTRIPSPEPEKKLVPLDLFPSNLLETITTSKTFTPDLPADFSGAHVDIKMREFPGARTRTLSTSFGWNAGLTGKNAIAAPTAGSEWLGFAAAPRSVPAAVRAAGNFTSGVTQAHINEFVNSFRNSWSSRPSTGAPAGSIGFTTSGNDQLLGRQFGYVFSGTYSFSEEARNDEVRALAESNADGGTAEVDRFAGQTARTSILWGGVVNASTLLGQTSRLAVSANYNRSADNEARSEIGHSETYGNDALEITRLRYVERGVGSAQLLGEHEFAARHRLTWSLTGSQVTRVEPDRSEFVYKLEESGQPSAPTWLADAAEGAVRTFGDLTENALDAKLDFRMGIGRARNSFLKTGGLFRTARRDADNFAYAITAPNLPITSRQLRPEEVFDGRFSQPGMNTFRVAPLSQGGSYQADDQLAAVYAMADLALTDRIRLIGGGRLERSETRIIASPTVGEAVDATHVFTDMLPSLALNVALTDRQHLRLSASQTLSRPEYRELAAVTGREVLGGEQLMGNPDLVRALIKNFDARWELYPKSGEVLSVALFAKTFDHPIERIYIGTSGTRVVTFLNANGATNYGVEVEARKHFGFLMEALQNFTGFMNATLMKSEIKIGSASVGASRINDRRPMVGQSPYVVNAGLTYASATGSTSMTALYNVSGKRIVSAATMPLPDVYEQPRNQIDLALRLPLLSGVSGKLDIKNVLDEPIEIMQGTVVREYYRTGRIISAGLNWRL